VAPDVLPLVAPLAEPLAAPVAPLALPEEPVLEPLAGVPEAARLPEVEPLEPLEPLAVAPDVGGIVPEPAPVVVVDPLAALVPELEPVVGSALSPDGPVCGGLSEPVEQAAAAKRTHPAAEASTFRKLQVIAISSSWVPAEKTYHVCKRLTALAKRRFGRIATSLEKSGESDSVKRCAHVASGDASTPFDWLRADSNLSRREVARVSCVMAPAARSLARVRAGTRARRRAAGQKQRRREGPRWDDHAARVHAASVLRRGAASAPFRGRIVLEPGA
jgi:hypothetical protein